MDRPRLRKLIYAILVTDSEFMSFCSDYFTSVYKQFSSGMDRQQKITFLLDSISEINSIYDSLLDAYPTEVQRHEKRISLDASRLTQGISQQAQEILANRPPGWEYQLLSVVLSEELDKLSSLRRDFDLELTFGQGIPVPDYIEWVLRFRSSWTFLNS